MTKDLVLAALWHAPSYVSGETISRELGVSRAAVNQAVQALRKEGYEIASATNRGYRLLSAPDQITEGALTAGLGAERMKRVLCFDRVDSTNLRLQECAMQGKACDGLIAVANEQTGGRGRRGRVFHSPKDQGIYLSFLLRPAESGKSVSAADWTSLTARASLAVCRAIQRIYAVFPDIKWVNDLLLHNKKICGILTQMDLESESAEVRDIVIGIGVNVQERTEDFPPELQAIASSLYQETGLYCPRTALATAMIEELDALYANWEAGQESDLALYRAHCLVPGRTVLLRTPAGDRTAYAERIGDDFSLWIRHSDGSEEALRGGDITVRL